MTRSFDERGDAFDFNVALQDHLKRLTAPKTSFSASSSSSSASASAAPSQPKRDFSLKEGQTFSIAIPGGSSGKPRPKKEPSAAAGGGGMPFMLPPPPSGRKRD